MDFEHLQAFLGLGIDTPAPRIGRTWMHFSAYFAWHRFRIERGSTRLTCG